MAPPIAFPDIDPELVSIPLFGFELAIRWYALAYIVGLVLGWRYVVALVRRPALWGGRAPMSPEKADDLLSWMILGVILGGRLGYVLFYQPGYFLSHPLQIPAVWQGGMSFHGGLLGVVTVLVLFSRRNGLELLRVGDAVAAATPIGLFFGRLANFINAELWGRPTTVPWAVSFPGQAAQDCPLDWSGPCGRHPSQLYEAGLEGLLLFLLLFVAIRMGALARTGRVFALFLIGYGAARTFVEGYRQADAQYITADNPLGHVIHFGPEAGLSMGQLLSLPMVAVGIGLFLWSGRRR
jgi:phosphatidylglycerol---prolipoprotein diacylglyceryl transferase